MWMFKDKIGNILVARKNSGYCEISSADDFALLYSEGDGVNSCLTVISTKEDYNKIIVNHVKQFNNLDVYPFKIEPMEWE